MAESASRDILGLTWTIGQIKRVMPMFELNLNGLEKAVKHLMVRRR